MALTATPTVKPDTRSGQLTCVAPLARQIPESWNSLPSAIRARLEHEGLDSPTAWRSAGVRRQRIFGIPTPLVRRLDVLARGAP